MKCLRVRTGGSNKRNGGAGGFDWNKGNGPTTRRMPRLILLRHLVGSEGIDRPHRTVRVRALDATNKRSYDF